MNHWFWILLLLPLNLAAAFHADIEISSKQVRVDDELFITVVLQYPKGYTIAPNEMVAKLMERGTLSQPPFAFVKYEILKKEEVDNKIRETIRFELDPQMVGNHALTFLSIPFYPQTAGNGKEQELISPVMNVQVVPAPVKLDFSEISAPLLTFDSAYPILLSIENKKKWVTIPQAQSEARIHSLWSQKQIPWLSIMLLFLLLILFYFVWKKPKIETEKQRIIRIHRDAVEKLERLREKRLPKIAKYAEYLKELSEMVRSYFEERYAIPGSRQTTNEFFRSLDHKLHLDSHTRRKLKDFLLRADLVKFAQYIPTKDECAYAEIAARKVIDEHRY